VSTPARREAFARALPAERLRRAAAENDALEEFVRRHGLPRTADAVAVYLTSLIDAGADHGRGLRHRLALLDLHARACGRQAPSDDRDLRRYLRGLHRHAALEHAERGVDPLRRELLAAVVDAAARPTPSQLRDAALLLVADGAGLPAQVLHGLRWEHARFGPGSVEIALPWTPRYGRWPSPVRLDDAPGRPSARDALLAWRRCVGPANGPMWSPGPRPRDRSKMRPVLALLGPPATRGRREPLPPPVIGAMVDRVLAARARALRDAALLLVAYGAALGTDDARRLRQGDVRSDGRGLVVHVAGRRAPTAIRRRTDDGPCAATAWDAWREALAGAGAQDPALPAFTQIRGAAVTRLPMDKQGLNLVVAQRCEQASLDGDYAFTSLRAGFLRTAARAGVPAHVVAGHAGLAALRSVEVHARRENLVRTSAAGRVGL
jgi:integrase